MGIAKSAVKALLLLLPAAGLFGQVALSREFFAGYSWFRLSRAEPGLTAANLNGWNAAAKINFGSRIGLVADFGGNYGSRRMTPTQYQRLDTLPGTYRQHTILVGPEVRAIRGERFTLNVRALIGAAYIANLVLPLREPHIMEPPVAGLPAPPPLTELSMGEEKPVTAAVGGSFDYRISERFAWRILQPELVVVGLGGTASRKCARLSTGPVLTF